MASLADGLRIHLVVPVFERYDAVGNDLDAMRRELVAAGCEVGVFAEQWNPVHEAYTSRLDLADPIWRDPRSVIIYHHSTCWGKAEELLETTQGRVVVRFHNVTPPKFFDPYCQEHVAACTAGLHSTARLARLKTALYWCASTFNAQDLVARGAAWDNCRVMAPMHRIPELLACAPDLSLYGQLEHRTVLLFTGGLKPNKGHRTLIEAFALYHHGRNPASVLLLAGGIQDRLSGYLEELRALAVARGVGESVIFTGTVSEAALRFCYQRADVFLCASEHEGFCVPLVEAMAFGLPVVAKASTAVPETIGPAGLVFDNASPEVLAEAVDYLIEHPEIAAGLGRQARQRYQKCFAPPVMARRLLHLVEELEVPVYA